MKATKRGLELTQEEDFDTPSDIECFYSNMEDAVHNAVKKHRDEDIASDAMSFARYAHRMASLAEMWGWACDVYAEYENSRLQDAPIVLTVVPKYARPVEEWREEMGPVLWWKNSTQRFPYLGTPLDIEFDASYKWFSPIDFPEIPGN